MLLLRQNRQVLASGVRLVTGTYDTPVASVIYRTGACDQYVMEGSPIVLTPRMLAIGECCCKLFDQLSFITGENQESAV